MEIRKAMEQDVPQISKLLYQVNQVHADKRPDLFKSGERKYSNEELQELLKDQDKPIFVAIDGATVLGYAFCVLQRHEDVNWHKITTLYIDDLCVDEGVRGEGSR